MIARFLALLAIALLATGAVDPNDPFKAASIEERRGAAIPLDLPFVASTGQAVTLRRLAGGKPLLIAPVQHECPNICGVTLAGIADAIDGQAKYTPGRDFAIVALGIDPREGPAQAQEDLKRLAAQRPDGAWQPVALTGSDEAVHAVTDALGYRYAWSDQLNQYAHLSGTAVLTEVGTDTAHPLFSQMNSAGSRRTAHQFSASWKVPRFAVPSPKKWTTTCSRRCFLSAVAMPAAMTKPPPSVPLCP